MAVSIDRKKPKPTDKRLKMLLFGTAGAGKTTLATHFPSPLFIDTEDGASNDEYVDRIYERGGHLVTTTSFEEMRQYILKLMAGNHEYRTLVIDPVTAVYNEALYEAVEARGDDYGRHTALAKRQWQEVERLVTRLPMTVVAIARAKPNWVTSKVNGKVTREQDGFTYDGPDGLDYFFDLAMHVERRGNARAGIVTKTRIKNIKDGEVFCPLSYDEIADKYGRDVLEADAGSIELATPPMVDRANALVRELGLDDAVVAKWHTKAKANDFSEFAKDDLTKVIDWMEARL